MYSPPAAFPVLNTHLEAHFLDPWKSTDPKLRHPGLNHALFFSWVKAAD